MTLAVVFAGLLAGLASIPHCAAMCGPLAAYSCTRRPARAALPRWQLGRTVAYAIVGALAGGAGTWLVGPGASRWTPALVSWSCAVALAFSAYRVWPRTPGAVERAAPRRLGLRPARPGLAQRAMQSMAGSPLLFGAATALLPCGALATAILLAASTTTAGGGALSMMAFATGSAPGLLGVGGVVALLARVRKVPAAARVLASVLVLGALVLVARPLPALLYDAPSCCRFAPR